MDIEPTPEFVRWMLVRDCELRDDEEPGDLLGIERRLRPFQAYSLSLIERRLLNGICVAPDVGLETTMDDSPCGFKSDEVLELSGGIEHLRTQCGNCAANQWGDTHPDLLAGCSGMLVDGVAISNMGETNLTTTNQGGQSAIGHSRMSIRFERLLDESGLTGEFDERFVRTHPRWYGLWCTTWEDDATLEFAQRISSSLVELFDTPEQRLPWLRWGQALEVSRREKWPLLTEFSPSGYHDSRYWYMPPLCPRCRSRKEPGRRKCEVCSLVEAALPARKRHMRGKRPFWPLKNFLGDENAARFLSQYQAYRREIADEQW